MKWCSQCKNFSTAAFEAGLLHFAQPANLPLLGRLWAAPEFQIWSKHGEMIHVDQMRRAGKPIIDSKFTKEGYYACLISKVYSFTTLSTHSGVGSTLLGNWSNQLKILGEDFWHYFPKWTHLEHWIQKRLRGKECSVARWSCWTYPTPHYDVILESQCTL